jgi:hypothetical protein
VVHAEERSHSPENPRLRVEQIEIWGEGPIRRRIARSRSRRSTAVCARSSIRRDASFCASTSTSLWRTCENFPRGENIFISTCSAFRPCRFTSRTGPRKFLSPNRDDKNASAPCVTDQLGVQIVQHVQLLRNAKVVEIMECMAGGPRERLGRATPSGCLYPAGSISGSRTRTT